MPSTSALPALKTLSTDLNANLDVLRMTTAELAAKYGVAAQRVREFAIIQAQLRIADLTAQMQAQFGVLRETVAGFCSRRTTRKARRTYPASRRYFT